MTEGYFIWIYGWFSTELRGSSAFRGNWHLLKDTLILKINKPFNDDSLLKPETIKFKNTPSIGLDNNRIQIIVHDSIPFTIANVFINDDQSPIKLGNFAEALIPRTINKIRVQYQSISSRNFSLSPSSCNDFTVFIYDKKFIPMIYLIPVRKWLVKHGTLVPLDENNNPFKREIYRKTVHKDAFNQFLKK